MVVFQKQVRYGCIRHVGFSMQLTSSFKIYFHSFLSSYLQSVDGYVAYPHILDPQLYHEKADTVILQL